MALQGQIWLLSVLQYVLKIIYLEAMQLLNGLLWSNKIYNSSMILNISLFNKPQKIIKSYAVQPITFWQVVSPYDGGRGWAKNGLIIDTVASDHDLETEKWCDDVDVWSVCGGDISCVMKATPSLEK